MPTSRARRIVVRAAARSARAANQRFEVVPGPAVDLVGRSCRRGFRAGLAGAPPKQEVRLEFLLRDPKLGRDTRGGVSPLSAHHEYDIDAADARAHLRAPVT